MIPSKRFPPALAAVAALVAGAQGAPIATGVAGGPADELPAAVSEHLLRLRETPAGRLETQLEILLEAEAQAIDALVAALAEPGTRPDALRLLDERDRERVGRELRRGEVADPALVEELVAPFVERAWRRPLERELRRHAARLERGLREAWRPLLEVVPSWTSKDRELRRERVRLWGETLEEALPIVEGVGAWGDWDGDMLRKLHGAVEAAWKAHDAVRALAEEDLAALEAADVTALAAALPEAEGRRADLLALRRVLAERAGDEPDGIGEDPRTRALLRGLLLVASDRPRAALASSDSLDEYERELLRALHARRVTAANDAAAGWEDPPRETEREVLRTLNAYRLVLGRGPLELDPRLLAAARSHAAEMERLGFFDHESPVAEHRTLELRLALVDYPLGRFSECIYRGPAAARPAQVFRSWFDSRPHHRILIGEGFFQVGIGRSGGYFVADLGGDQGRPPWPLSAR